MISPSWFATEAFDAETETAFMDIEKVLEKLKEWLNRLADALFGPQAQPESEPIPVPVDDRRIR